MSNIISAPQAYIIMDALAGYDPLSVNSYILGEPAFNAVVAEQARRREKGEFSKSHCACDSTNARSPTGREQRMATVRPGGVPVPAGEHCVWVESTCWTCDDDDYLCLANCEGYELCSGGDPVDPPTPWPDLGGWQYLCLEQDGNAPDAGCMQTYGILGKGNG